MDKKRVKYFQRRFKEGSYVYILIIVGAIVLVWALVTIMIKSGDYLIFQGIWKITANLWWLIFPVPLWLIFREAWDEYNGLLYIVSRKNVLLEIIPPADIEKSPKLMEHVFAGIWNFSTLNKFDVHCGWKPMQDTFSFELASIEGTVHYYIRCFDFNRNYIEAQIYAQYPDTEIREAEDYTKMVPINLPNKDWEIWGTGIKLDKEDAVPIRTFRQFKEDVTGNMVDPLASLIEMMGNAGKDQHIWFQIIFTPLNNSDWYPESKKLVDKITKRAKVESAGKFGAFIHNILDVIKNVPAGIVSEPVFTPATQEEAVKEKFNVNELTPGEQEMLKAIEENISKPGYKVAMRYVFTGKRENMDRALGKSVVGVLSQFSDLNLNSLKADSRTKTYANYYFEESRMRYRQRKVLQQYRDRAFGGNTFVFNTEEMATVFHFPDMSIKTPTLRKIEAKKGEAPANLPIEMFM